MAEWQPQVEQRPHPFGEQGVRSSLDEVCQRAAEGAAGVIKDGVKLTKVRTWAIEKLDDARKRGESVGTPRDRARVLLAACQKKLWVPDPIGVEHIFAAHLLACDDHGTDGSVCVKGEDCDSITVLLAACLCAVGIYTMIVGHGYGPDGDIGHVLTAAYVGHGEWLYADPSAPDGKPAIPLGECVAFTRERLYSIPNIKVLCDGRNCLQSKRFDPEQLGFVTQGTFVGVNGPPEALRGFAWVSETLLERAARKLRR